MERYERLKDMILENGYTKVAEIGVDSGITTQFLIKHCPLHHYLLVDPNENKHLTDRINHLKFVKFLPVKSEVAVRAVPDESLDLVFIDGDHSYEACKFDIEEWGKKVRKGGILCGHDYQHSHQGVRDAVDEAFGKNFIQHEDCAMWVVKK